MNETSAALRTAALDVMAIDDVTEGVASPYVVFLGNPPPRPDEPGQGVRLRGRLLLAPDEAYERLTQRYRLLGFTPLLRQEDEVLSHPYDPGAAGPIAPGQPTAGLGRAALQR